MSATNPPPSDGTAAIAVMSHQIGEIKHAIEATSREARAQLDDHGKRIGVLEEAQIRQDEREKTEERLRLILGEQQSEQSQQHQNKVTLRLSRWQMWFGAIAALAMVLSVIVAAFSLFH